MRVPLFAACLMGFALPLAAAPAQLVPVKTVPITEGDQFAFLPSANAGMVVSLAVIDTVLDPFRNPATGARLRNGFFFGSPSFYALTHDGGQGSTLPLGVLSKAGPTFGGVAVAVQDIGPHRSTGSIETLDAQPVALTVGGSAPTDNRDRTNRYALAMLGRTLSPTLSVAASVSLFDLTGIDGAQTLYAGNQSLDQSDHLADVRLGLLQQWTRDRSLEVLALRDHWTMAHEILFSDGVWDPTTRSTKFTSRTEHNADAIETFGGQLRYRQAVRDSSWHASAELTGNRTRYLVAPTMGSMDLAAEPLRSVAVDAGVGLSRSFARTTAAIDAIFEPISGRGSQTGKPNDDQYHFTNGVLRGGVSHTVPLKTPGSAMQFLAGMELRAVHYRLDQADSTGTVQRSTEHWNEWTHSASMNLLSTAWEMQLLLRVRSGTSRPATVSGFGPTGALTPATIPVRTVTEQITFRVPIR